MSKTFKYSPDNAQQNKQASKKAKLTKQQAGRVEKAMLRNCDQPSATRKENTMANDYFHNLSN